jgi:cytochrome c-type biogenesis protein CcmH
VNHLRAPLACAALLACVLALLAPAVASAACTSTSLPDIEDEVMCTICGTLLAESDSPQADRERALIRDLLARCETKGQIENALVAQYGPQVLATPSGHGFDLFAWLVPGVAIAAALGGIAYVLVRQRPRRLNRDAPPEVSPADSARLDRDMSSYDV